MTTLNSKQNVIHRNTVNWQYTTLHEDSFSGTWQYVVQ